MPSVLLHGDDGVVPRLQGVHDRRRMVRRQPEHRVAGLRARSRRPPRGRRRRSRRRRRRRRPSSAATSSTWATAPRSPSRRRRSTAAPSPARSSACSPSWSSRSASASSSRCGGGGSGRSSRQGLCRRDRRRAGDVEVVVVGADVDARRRRSRGRRAHGVSARVCGRGRSPLVVVGAVGPASPSSRPTARERAASATMVITRASYRPPKWEETQGAARNSVAHAALKVPSHPLERKRMRVARARDHPRRDAVHRRHLRRPRCRVDRLRTDNLAVRCALCARRRGRVRPVGDDAVVVPRQAVPGGRHQQHLPVRRLRPDGVHDRAADQVLRVGLPLLLQRRGADVRDRQLDRRRRRRDLVRLHDPDHAVDRDPRRQGRRVGAGRDGDRAHAAPRQDLPPPHRDEQAAE